MKNPKEIIGWISKTEIESCKCHLNVCISSEKVAYNVFGKTNTIKVKIIPMEETNEKA